jgi:tetratricopeptide (TPR) repeat protein
MFSMFNKNKEVKGEIGYYGLQDWWLSAFTEEERNHIEDVFHPLGSNQNDKPLTEGDISYSSGTSAGLLHSLAGWFNSPRDREIAKKIIEKANELAPKGADVLDYHFTQQQTMEIYYRERDTSPEALEKAIQACREQISIAPQVAAAFLKEYPEQPLPAHAGYRQLRIILEKQGEYDEAIELCEQGKQQGWADNWDKMIETLRKKKKKGATNRS